MSPHATGNSTITGKLSRSFSSILTFMPAKSFDQANRPRVNKNLLIPDSKDFNEKQRTCGAGGFNKTFVHD
jgi:hypothetical protein